MVAAQKLDAATMVAEAETDAGTDDWGEPSGYWREGLDVLVDALESEARLSETGRMAMGVRLGQYLRNRLAVVDWRAGHGDELDVAIEGPLIITGLPRTGTTALSNLLAADPATRSLRVWESGSPVPPPEAATQHDDDRIAATQAGLDIFEQMVPAMKAMHHDTATSTAESIDLLGMSFHTHHFAGMADVASYDQWWLECDMVPAYRFHREVLEMLGSRCPPRRWHLKNPPDLFCLEAVAAVYPEARFVWTHRHPADVLASVASLVATVQTLVTDDVDAHGVGAHQLDLWATAVERGMGWRADHPDRFVDVAMVDIVSRPVEAVAGIYDAAGWELTADAEQAMATWAEANALGRHGEHRPDPAEFGLDPARITERFVEYVDRFGLEET